MSYKKKIEKLSEVFDAAEEQIDQMEIGDDGNMEITLSTENYAEIDPTLTDDGTVFELTQLKSKFTLGQQNISRLIRIGMDLVNQASVLQLADLNGKQIEAISGLSRTVSDQVKDQVGLYKEIIDIELKMKQLITPALPDNIPEGANVQQNNVIFTGDSASLLNHLKKNKQQ